MTKKRQIVNVALVDRVLTSHTCCGCGGLCDRPGCPMAYNCRCKSFAIGTKVVHMADEHRPAAIRSVGVVEELGDLDGFLAAKVRWPSGPQWSMIGFLARAHNH